MADVKKPIDSVTTFVAEIEKPSIELVIAKFQGKHTLRTLAAARRIRGKKERVKIPRNLLRQLFRGTGGWNDNCLKPGWPSDVPSSAKKVTIGDLTVSMWDTTSGRSSGYPGAALEYRGRKAAHVPAEWRSWRDDNKAKGFLAALGK